MADGGTSETTGRMAYGEGRDPAKVAASRQKRLASNRALPEEVRRQKHREWYARLKADPARWERMCAWQKEYKRKLRRAAGKPETPSKAWNDPNRPNRDRAMSALARRNAYEAWRYWIKTKAPARWIRDYYRAIGKPWLNPRITERKAWRIRYWLDTEFRANELDKTWRRKAQRAAQIAATDDGTLNAADIACLLVEATHCPYCGKHMQATDKTIDHMTPLILGGSHSITNVLVCCASCNFRKQAKPYDVWMKQLSD